MERARSLKTLIDDPSLLIMPGVWDGFSAKLVEQYGYESALVTGAGLSESRLGRPDVGIMGLAENVQANSAISACSDLLLLADADTGYGNAVHVFFTVQAFEATGVDGVTIEDQVHPKRCGHMDGKEVIAAEEAREKIRAAVDAKQDPSFVIKARTDAARYLGIDEAIRRARMFVEMGADLIAADAMMSEADIAKFTGAVDAPVSVNMGFGLIGRSTTPLVPPSRLHDMGVSVVSYPRLLSAAAVKGMKTTLEEFKRVSGSEEIVARPDLLATFDELQDLMGLRQIESLEERYTHRTQEERVSS